MSNQSNTDLRDLLNKFYYSNTTNLARFQDIVGESTRYCKHVKVL